MVIDNIFKDASSLLTSKHDLIQIRWKEKVRMYEDEIRNVVGDVFIAAACIAYCGAFTTTYREQLIKLWTECCKKSVSDGHTEISYPVEGFECKLVLLGVDQQ